MANYEHADFTPSAPNFKQLVYMNMQQLTNFPYIEDDFDALTNYGLLCKVVDYLNQVIDNNNEQNTVVTNLYNAFVELQDYINDFFDNLDVQEEINNKLDEMTVDGSLTQIIKNYVDPIYEDFEEEINGVLEIQNQNITNISNRVSQVASGSPLVASSTSGMTDTTRIYVNTTDGHWYYYNGSVWTDGGTYQSTELDDGEVTPEKTSFLTRSGENLFKVMNKTENGFTSAFDLDTQKTSFSGGVNATQRILIMTQYLEEGNYAFKHFDASGTKPAIYVYTETNYENESWNDNEGYLASGNYGANITIPEDGTYYFVVYLAKDATFNYQGKLLFAAAESYSDLTAFVPITYDFKSYINQTMTQATTNLNKFTNIDYWKNKKCLIYGDSLTQWGSWGTYLENQFGLDVTNSGIAGSTAVYNPDYEGSDSTHAGSADLRLATLQANNDLIVVMFGTNDYLRNYELGTVPNTFNVSDTFDNTKYAGAMLKILHYLYTNNPNARIIVMCPPWNHYQTNQKGTLRTYGDKLMEVARLTTTPCIDLFAKMNANALNYSEYYNDAGTHFNDAGYMRIASLLKEEIEELTPIYTE